MKIQTLLFGLLILIGLTSCEDVIVLDLENDEPQLVIEAVVNMETNTARVFLTKSNGFYDGIKLETVDNAGVFLTFEDGSTVDLTLAASGIYLASGINIEEGENLTVTVIEATGETHTATTTAPHDVVLDSLQILPTDRPAPGQGNPLTQDGGDGQYYQVFAHWQDVVGKESFYRVRATVNDTLQSSFRVTDDLNRSSSAISVPLLQSFLEGDTVEIELLSLDKPTFIYFSELAAIQGQGMNSTTPFNPKSVFSSGALGYFGIVRGDVMQVILP